MNSKVFNLALAVFWAAICIGLLTRHWWMPDDLNQRMTGDKTPLVIALTAILTLWNLMRFAVAKWFATPAKESAQVTEYRRRIRAMSGEDPKVTDPQFKFNDDPLSDTPNERDRS